MVSRYQLKILCYAASRDGCTIEELVRKFGSGVSYALGEIVHCIGTNAMYSDTDEELNEDDYTLYRVTSRGHAEIQEAKAARSHSRRELWENRFFGFVVGVLVPVIIELLTK